MDNLIEANTENINTSLAVHEENIISYMDQLHLPTTDILVPIPERKKALKNFTDAIDGLDEAKLREARYISKFFAAVAAGLFDAALNYLWDETVFQLRKRIANYDIEYFYDVAVTTDKRNKLSGVNDLSKLDDKELIQGAREIDMISDVGYQHLDYIKYMRNWASAAHPNQAHITGLQLISWLETCIKEVINLPDSRVTIETGRYLKNLKQNSFSEEEIRAFSSFVVNLTVEKANSIAAGLFGIYYRTETAGFVKDNIKQVFPTVWERISEDTRNEFGIKYARFAVNGDGAEAQSAKELLELVDGQAYFPEEIRTTRLVDALDRLMEAHNGMNNFYREPPFAYQLKREVGEKNIPTQINPKYVYSLIMCFIGNGHGVCWDADSTYRELIENFTQEQIIIAAFSILEESISSMLQFPKCSEKYLEMVDIINSKNSSAPIREVLDTIKSRSESLSTIRKDTVISEQIEARKRLLQLN